VTGRYTKAAVESNCTLQAQSACESDPDMPVSLCDLFLIEGMRGWSYRACEELPSLRWHVPGVPAILATVSSAASIAASESRKRPGSICLKGRIESGLIKSLMKLRGLLPQPCRTVSCMKPLESNCEAAKTRTPRSEKSRKRTDSGDAAAHLEGRIELSGYHQAWTSSFGEAYSSHAERFQE
jgi:hypothetical protein